MTVADEERFFAKVEQAGDCWTWTAAKDQNGYGLFSLRGTIRSYIWSYRFLIGEYPTGLELDHLCRNRACVNPWHLDPVPHIVNSRRKPPRQKCKQGHALAGDNLYISPIGRRICKTCAQTSRELYHRRSKP